MDSVKQSADIYRLIAWADANRKRLIIAVSVVVVVGAGIGLYLWNTDRREEEANNAVAALKVFSSVGGSQKPPAADEYLKIANDYSGTSAGGRALLLAAGAMFDTGKYPDAQQSFERFLQQYPESPLAAQAQLGIAACLEAGGKDSEAATKYKEYHERHQQGDPGLPQAASALARLYTKMGKPDQALKLYEEMAKSRGNDTWSAEAGIQAEEILAKHPELRPQPAPPAPMTPSHPGLTLPAPSSPHPAAAPAPAVSNLLLDLPLPSTTNH